MFSSDLEWKIESFVLSLHFFISRLLPGLLMGWVCESFLPILLLAGGNRAREESVGQKGLQDSTSMKSEILLFEE